MNQVHCWRSWHKLDSHSIHLDWQLSSDHASLMVIIPIVKEHVNLTKHSISKGSKEESSFINDVSLVFRSLNMFNISDSTSLDKIINNLVQEIENGWEKHLKIVKIMKHSKSWWDDKCNSNLEKYRASKSLEAFQKMVKNTKYVFFNHKI